MAGSMANSGILVLKSFWEAFLASNAVKYIPINIVVVIGYTSFIRKIYF